MKVAFFVSYAEKDARRVRQLLALLEPHLKASRRYDYQLWEFHQLLPGERWDDRIRGELATSDGSLLCISPAFLASGYITTVEIPAMLRHRAMIPIGLVPVDFNLHDWHSLDAYQLFRLRSSRGGLRWFSELRSAADREAFALELFRQIEGRLA